MFSGGIEWTHWHEMGKSTAFLWDLIIDYDDVVKIMNT